MKDMLCATRNSRYFVEQSGLWDYSQEVKHWLLDDHKEFKSKKCMIIDLSLYL